MAIVKVRSWANTKAFTIPAKYAKIFDIQIGDLYECVVEKTRMIYTPIDRYKIARWLEIGERRRAKTPTAEGEE